jgi:hypothetical protein
MASARERLLRGLRVLPISCVSIAATFALLLAVLVAFEFSRLPSINQLARYLPSEAIAIGPQQCIEEPIRALPVREALLFRPALLAAEGDHHGELRQLFGFASERSGRDRPGHYSSLIARTLFCNQHESDLRRSLDEVILSIAIDLRFTPDERMTIYLNRAYLGEGQVGFSNASHHYFGCTPEKTTLPQRALLMGLARNPAYYSPTKHPERALLRRNAIVTAMFERGDISKADQESAESAALPASLGSVPRTN